MDVDLTLVYGVKQDRSRLSERELTITPSIIYRLIRITYAPTYCLAPLVACKIVNAACVQIASFPSQVHIELLNRSNIRASLNPERFVPDLSLLYSVLLVRTPYVSCSF